ncbi:hypothetical protein BH09VER1_BH09VER1_50770 [soil metagenome]
MKPQELFEIWAPRDGLWSPWAKPVLFFHLPVLDAPRGLPPPLDGYQWAPVNDGTTALVIDLAGAQGIYHALICARAGFRPVPLYNSCPGPGELVNLTEIIEALFEATQDLTEIPFRTDAPPVFLLDSRRLDGFPIPARFDNRWMVFPQDFPSANLLKSAGFTKILLIQKDQRQPSQDLAVVLAAWEKLGLTIFVDSVHDTLAPRAINIRIPNTLPSLFYRALALIGFHKNSAGGFGSIVPTPTESSGFG